MAVLATLVWTVLRTASSDQANPVAATDYRMHSLQEALRSAAESPGTIEEIIRKLPENERDALRVDGYGYPILFTRKANSYELRSPGADGVVGSADDYVLTGSLSDGEW